MALAFGSSRQTLRSEIGAAWLVRYIVLAARRARERRMLLELSDDQLMDIGLTPFDVGREASRWPWDGCYRSLYIGRRG